MTDDLDLLSCNSSARGNRQDMIRIIGLYFYKTGSFGVKHDTDSNNSNLWQVKVQVSLWREASTTVSGKPTGKDNDTMAKI